jgi:hypothetical protein
MSRPQTMRLYEMIDSGQILYETVVDMCLGFMSEDDVAEMMDSNELSERFENESDIDESQEC